MTNSKLNTEAITGLFVAGGNPTIASNQAMNPTQRLTAVADGIANDILTAILTDVEGYQGKVEASKLSHDAMDDLINELEPLAERAVEVDFLKDLTEDELERMIRSQQSKRSRAKSKEMTQENYTTMLVGAIAENLLRIVANKPKSSGGGAIGGEVTYSQEDLEQLAQFPEDLKKAIRNVQSKKSIMKSKVGFSEDSERWQQLLEAERQLKSVRSQTTSRVSEKAAEAIEAKTKAEELLTGVDLNDLPAEEATQMLNQLKEMLASR